MKLIKELKDNNVTKLVYSGENAVAETVVYNYKERGVICFSVQSGCKVGCVFCGTGKNFLRDLTREEMDIQIKDGLKLLKGKKKIQIMAMSMGEPSDNWTETYAIAKKYLDKNYYFFVSTVGTNNYKFHGACLYLGKKYNKFGLQFSLHNPYEEKRRKLLGNYSKLISLDEISVLAHFWKEFCEREVYFNYIATGREKEEDFFKIKEIIGENHLTVSVLCSKTKAEKGNIKKAKDFLSKYLSIFPTAKTKLFDPEGQDTIGGGCGQLLYVQERLKKEKKDKE